MFDVPARLAYAVTQDATIFLDIDNDRYFRLPTGLEATFRAAVTDAAKVGDELDRLIQLGVLERRPGVERPGRPTCVPVAESVVDTAVRRGGARPTTVLLAAGSLMRAQALLRRGFSEALAIIQARSGHKTSREVEAVRSACLAFMASRRFVPIPPVCLLDSVALLDFLGRQGLDADLVFGVIARPFSAHCWLQIDGLALNDELDNLTGRTPILVV
jgi:hypothetical protein